MKKRILTCLLALLAVLTMMVPAWAEQTEDDIFINDTAGLLNEDEWLELEMLADEISWRYRCAVYTSPWKTTRTTAATPTTRRPISIMKTTLVRRRPGRHPAPAKHMGQRLRPVHPGRLCQQHGGQICPNAVGGRLSGRLCR